jgi:hypothetical protein
MVAKSHGQRNDRLWHGTVDRLQHRSKTTDPRTAVPVIVHRTRVFPAFRYAKRNSIRREELSCAESRRNITKYQWPVILGTSAILEL